MSYPFDAFTLASLPAKVHYPRLICQSNIYFRMIKLKRIDGWGALVASEIGRPAIGHSFALERTGIWRVGETIGVPNIPQTNHSVHCGAGNYVIVVIVDWVYCDLRGKNRIKMLRWWKYSSNVLTLYKEHISNLSKRQFYRYMKPHTPCFWYQTML